MMGLSLRSILIASAFLATQATLAADGKVSGFVDAQYHIERGELDFGTLTLDGRDNTFKVNQGALYYSKDVDKTGLFIDLPFMQNTNGGTFNFATAIAQAYVKMTCPLGSEWKLGQWDTIFGLESNDTVDSFFPTQGAVFNILPATHTGALGQYKVGSVNLQLILANGKQEGIQSNTNAGSHELGFRASTDSDQFRGGIGFLQNQRDGACTFADCATEMMLDVAAGKTFGKMDLDFEYTNITAPNGESRVSPTQDRDPITGMTIMAKYALNDVHSVGLRYETVTGFDYNTGSGNPVTTDDVTAQSSVNDTNYNKITLGVSHKSNESLTTKFDISQNSLDVSNAASSRAPSWMEAHLAAVMRF